MIRHWKVAALAVTLVLVVLGAWSSVRAVHGLRQVGQASVGARSLEERLASLYSIDPADTAQLQGSIAQVGTHLDQAQRDLTPLLQISSLLGWVPRIGPKLGSAQDMLALGSSLVHASNDLLYAVNVAAGSSQGEVQLLQGNRFNEEVLQSMSVGEPFLNSAMAHLGQARTTLDRLESRKLPQDFMEMVDTARGVLPELEMLSRTGLAASSSWRSLLGYETPRTYMLVAHNSDELRATGGFIPGAWLITLDQGEITRLEFWDTMAVDDLAAGPPLPPEGLLQSLWGGAWLFRDAGWYPDFPTSARVMEQIFRLGQGTSVDGVIGLNQWAIQGILEAIGPATLPTGETLNASSYMEVLEEKTDAHGRGFVDTVLGSLLDRLREQGSNQSLTALMSALNKSLRQKQLLLYFHDSTMQEITRANGWDGALGDLPGDYLMVVDSNVGFSKINRNIARQVDYTVDLSVEGEARAHLDILYTNESTGAPEDSCRIQSSSESGLTYQQQKNTCYWNYLRIYSQTGSTLQSSSPFPMPEGALYRRIGYNDIEDTLTTYTESDKSVFAGFFTVDVGKSRRVAFAYDLPPQVVERKDRHITYNLFLQKQPGTRSTPVEVTVKTPMGYCLYQATPAPISWSASEVQFAIGLDSDTRVQLVLERKTTCKGPAKPSPAQEADLPQGRTLTAFASLVVEPARGSGKVDYIQVSPQDATLVPGQRFLFTAIALDSEGRPVRNTRFQWRVRDPAAGTVTSSGLFTTGSSPGTYANAVEVSATSPEGTTTATASVTIVTRVQGEARRLSSVIVYPSEVTVRSGQVVGLGALGWDDQGRFVQNLRFQWSMISPEAGSVDQMGFLTAPQAAGRYPNALRVVAVQDTPDGPVEREAFVSVTVGESTRRGLLSRIVVIPGNVTLTPGQGVSFITRALDEGGQTVRGVSFTWEVTQPAAGQMDKPGQFIASSSAGEYPAAIKIVARQDPQESAAPYPGSTLPVLKSTLPVPEGILEVEATVGVTVRSPAAVSTLSAARVAPGAVTLEPGERWVLTAFGMDDNGNAVPVTASWEVVDPLAGYISPLGIFTAGSEPGVFPNAVRVQLSQGEGDQRRAVEAFATVNILGPLERLEVSPSTVTLEAGQSTRMVAVGYDANGLEIPSLRLRWSMENPTAGSIDQTGLFTAGATPGRYENAVKVMAAEANER